MAEKGWTTQVAAAAGVAAATGAAQLGLGYGLGVVVWPVTPAPDDSVWLGSLGWATWIAASSTVFGAMIAAALRGGPTARPSGPLRFALAFFAGLGALLTVALVALPARSAVRTDALAPQTTAAVYALIGIALGVVIAYWAVVSGPVAANLIATSAYLWALAAIAIVVELTGGRPAATYLTSWQFAPLGDDQRYGTIYWPSALITVFAAFLLGVIAAWPAARRGNLGVGTAASGAVGPVLVAAAFLLLAPQLTGAIGPLQSAYLIAPYAVLAGLAGSALVVTTGQRAAQREKDDHHRPAPPAATGTAHVGEDADDDEPTQELGQVRPAKTAPRPRAEQPAKAAARPAAPPRQAAAPQKATPQNAGPQNAGPQDAGPAKTAPQKEVKPSIASRLRRDKPAAQQADEDERTAEITPPRKSTVAAPPPTPQVAKINPPRAPESEKK